MPKQKEVKIIGETIVEARRMTAEELAEEGWDIDNMHGHPITLVLSNGTVIYPSCDEEGNSFGVLVGYSGKGKSKNQFALIG